ncbi:MAG: DUF4339 domain-containing protein [Verrucomicrobia bacterium]|nr:MAG: DUF4339 domain-containing protein [Verrucomicrobiota bacterium]
MSNQWHLLINGQQYGPYSEEDLLQFVREGRVVRDSLLWTEGMHEWVAAATLEGLFPAVPAAVPAARAMPRPVAAGNVTSRSPQRTTSAGKPATQRGRVGKAPTHAVPSGPYQPPQIKAADFRWLLILLGSGVTLVVIAIWAQWQLNHSEVKAQAAQIMWLRLMWLAAVGCLMAWVGSNGIYLYRIWSILQHGRARTTPAKAVGLLFVPLFNMYWNFVAFYGLAQDWNRITTRHADLNGAPKLNAKLFLAFSCCSIVAPPVALILWFPLMQQICRAITFMAMRPRLRASTPRPK